MEGWRTVPRMERSVETMKRIVAFILSLVMILAALAASANGAVECDWTMTVSGTDQRQLGDFTFIYTLDLTAEKKGGTTDQGAYTGTARLTMHFDASQMSKISRTGVAGFVDMDMSADSFTFDVVGYNEEAYSNFGGEDVLAPLVQYDSMALVDLPLTITGDHDVSSAIGHSSGGYINEESTLPMKVAIDGGQVTVSIDVPWFYGTFHGMVVGTPK